jgi:hypothetical protein
MRTIPIPPVVLCLLTPLLALAQSKGVSPTDNQWVARSPQTWAWAAAVVVAVVAFVWSTIVVSRRKGGPGGPPNQPRSS